MDLFTEIAAKAVNNNAPNSRMQLIITEQDGYQKIYEITAQDCMDYLDLCGYGDFTLAHDYVATLLNIPLSDIKKVDIITKNREGL